MNEELRVKIQQVHNLLMALQPHIESCCYPKTAGFIDNYVDPALEILNGVLNEK